MLVAPEENHAAVVVKQADAGVVISSDCGTDIVSAAKILMESDELRRRYAANARAYAERSFNIVSIADRFLEVFSKS
jgi:glycosyltransferase involved in cell wall biosynthesis